MGPRVYVLVTAVGFASAGCDPAPVALTNQDSGHDVALAMDQGLVITLQTIGPGSYGMPTISSSVLHFEGVTYPGPPVPSGPTQRYEFAAAAEGSALLDIPFDGGLETPFTLTVRCCAR
jgi:hypothetical protein